MLEEILTRSFKKDIILVVSVGESAEIQAGTIVKKLVELWVTAAEYEKQKEEQL